MGRFRRSELHEAVAWKRYDDAKRLLEQGADPNATDEDGQTPLHYASDMEIPKTAYKFAKLLLEYGADPNARDKWGKTPLHYAVGWHSIDNSRLVKLLLEFGANPNVRDENGQTPLYCATDNGHFNEARILLEYGANPNIPTKSGKVPLHAVLSRWPIDMDWVSLLLEHGANPNVRDENGITPLHNASRYCEPNIVKLLLDFGANPNIAEFQKHKTPLHEAIYSHLDVNRRKCEQTIIILVQHGAVLFQRDVWNERPIDLIFDKWNKNKFSDDVKRAVMDALRKMFFIPPTDDEYIELKPRR